MRINLNLFGNEGFQEEILRAEAAGEPAEKATEKEEVKKKSRSFLKHEFGAIAVAVIIGALIWWYFMLKTSVRSEISEYSPQEFKMRSEMPRD